MSTCLFRRGRDMEIWIQHKWNLRSDEGRSSCLRLAVSAQWHRGTGMSSGCLYVSAWAGKQQFTVYWKRQRRYWRLVLSFITAIKWSKVKSMSPMHFDISSSDRVKMKGMGSWHRVFDLLPSCLQRRILVKMLRQCESLDLWSGCFCVWKAVCVWLVLPWVKWTLPSTAVNQ